MRKISLILLLMTVPAIAGTAGYSYLYPRFAGVELPDTWSGGGTTVIIIPGDGSSSWNLADPFGHSSMMEVWDSVSSEDAKFTVRAGDEFLVYSNHTLIYTSGDLRSNVVIYPEELWTLYNHCFWPISPATGEVSMEAWFPGMDEPVMTFLTVNDPAMSMVQVLLQRGRLAAE